LSMLAVSVVSTATSLVHPQASASPFGALAIDEYRHGPGESLSPGRRDC